MNSIRQISRLNTLELEKVTPPTASWHTDYRDTAYIHIGGLPFDLSEGDILAIFSQYGNPVHVHLVRDKESGKSRGFGFLKFEDQRSCDLAVDNLSGAQVLGRVVSVDHARYQLKEGERETVGEDVEEEEEEGRGKRRRSESESSQEEEERAMLKEEVELARLMREHDDDDPMKSYLVKEKKAEIEEALRAVAISEKPKMKKNNARDREVDSGRKHKHRHHHRSRREEDDRNPNQKQKGGRRTKGHRSRRREEGGSDNER